ncbi:hypothetical protein Glove_140g41 [Diversispora epigaea]|uniref:Uncharacterized protein n=1 Tax=Diversispora epigaea TaxID=1348612 RepID=A0A397J1A0_9GLOM|nr:hypothetical protein Glove_140g41 [Diversispora epigaea]
MVRKRSLASILYEDNTSLDRNRNSRNRLIFNILGEESTSSQPSSSSRLVLCNCLKCNGRLIDLRTKNNIIPNLTFLPRIRPKRHTNQPISVEIFNIITDNEVLNISSEDEIKKMEEINIESEEESANEFSNIFKDYSLPNYDPDKLIDPKSTNNNSYLWILL